MISSLEGFVKKSHIIILAIACGIFCVQALGDKRSASAQRKLAGVASTKILKPLFVIK